MADRRRLGVDLIRFARAWAALTGLVFGLGGCADFGTLSGGHTTLWRIQGDHNVVYLLGSVHVLPASAYPVRPPLQKAFDDSQRVVFEINLDTITSRDVSEEFKRAGFYPPGDALARHVSAGTKAALQRLLPAFGTSWEKVQRFRPWFLAELLSSRYLEAVGFREDLGVDEYFYRKAHAAHRAIEGLETLRDQARILTGFNDGQSEAYLRSTLAGLPGYAAILGAVVRAWQNGQTELLDQLLNEDKRSDPQGFRLLFADRNAKWLPAIERLTRAPENVLVIVGAGHLVGHEGVVEAMRQRGYRVRQL